MIIPIFLFRLGHKYPQIEAESLFLKHISIIPFHIHLVVQFSSVHLHAFCIHALVWLCMSRICSPLEEVSIMYEALGLSG